MELVKEKLQEYELLVLDNFTPAGIAIIQKRLHEFESEIRKAQVWLDDRKDIKLHHDNCRVFRDISIAMNPFKPLPVSVMVSLQGADEIDSRIDLSLRKQEKNIEGLGTLKKFFAQCKEEVEARQDKLVAIKSMYKALLSLTDVDPSAAEEIREQVLIKIEDAIEDELIWKERFIEIVEATALRASKGVPVGSTR